MKTDLELQRDVLDEFEWEPSINAAEIGVVVESGIVTLTGYVHSFTEKWAADRIAKRVHGVKAVANDIVVRLPGTSQRTDADIARTALSALGWDLQVPEGRVQISVSDGWVTLEGNVDWQYQKAAAERSIHNLTGVKGVSNLITITPRATPKEIKTKIEAALKRSAEIEAQRIMVEAQDGKVVLRGHVHSWSEREEAERAAWAAPGVSSVEDHITVGV